MPPRRHTALVPGPLRDLIGYHLRVVQLASFRRFEALLGRYGPAPRYLGLLAIIGHNPGQPQSRLAEAISVQRSSLVSIIDRLVEEGLVQRRTSSVDRRANAVSLTPEGERVVAELTALALEEEAHMTAGLTPEEKGTLLRLLSRVGENLG